MSNRVIPAGSINPNATIAPGVVVIESITPGVIAGIPTNLVGVVGTASWGPKNAPITVATTSDYISNFGTPLPETNDMGAFVNAATQQGTVGNYVCVRVTDGTDVSAVGRLRDAQAVGAVGALLTAKYTGVTGNNLKAYVTAGSVTGTYTVSIGRPGYVAETYPNISGSGATLWTNIINAINNGVSSRGPSNLVVASAGDSVAATTITAGGSGYTAATISASGGGGSGFAATVTVASGAVTAITVTNRGTGYTSAPTLTISGDGTGATATASLVSTNLPSTALNPYAFAGGTNGNSGVTGTTQVGTNGAIPTGMYALASSNVSLFALVNCTTTSTFAAQDTFAGETGSIAVLPGPSGQTVAQAVTAKAGLSLDSDSIVYLVGDWCLYLDPYDNGSTRLVTPQAYYCGLMANLSPELSPLNKRVHGILATQKSQEKQIYSDSDYVSAMQNGLEIISIPIPAGNNFGCETGKSGGTELTTNNVCIQRMANFLSYSLSRSGVLGAFIGQLQTPTVRLRAKSALESFLATLVTNQQIEAFVVVLDETNNPENRVELGFMEAQVTVQLFSVIIVFLIDLNVGTAKIIT